MPRPDIYKQKDEMRDYQQERKNCQSLWSYPTRDHIVASG
jgi:GH25 family lysozyme M1 (1,4-beta-N-acetylmuramidase)